jgi:hypothetical protein
LEAIRNSGEYEPGEQIPKATFAKEFVSQGIGSATAYRALVTAAEDGLLLEHPSGKQMAYSFPISQSFPKEELRKAQDNFSSSPEPLSSGNEKEGDASEMDVF